MAPQRTRRFANRIAIGAAAASLATVGTACGSNADDIARNLDDAIRATDSQLPTQSIDDAAADAQAQAAAKQAVCNSLSAYSSTPATSAVSALQDYAEREQILQGYTLPQADTSAVGRLADPLEAVEASQEAAEVADSLGC